MFFWVHLCGKGLGLHHRTSGSKGRFWCHMLPVAWPKSCTWTHRKDDCQWPTSSYILRLRKRKYLSTPPDGAGETGRIWTEQPVRGISLSDFFNMLKKGCQWGSTYRDAQQKLGPHALISGKIHQWRTVGLVCQGPYFLGSWFIIQQNRWFALNTCDCFRNSGNLIKNG